MGHRITFDGRFIEYFLISLGLLVVTVVTLGLGGVYWFYWSRKYFFSKLRIGDQRIVCTGGFGEFFLTALGLGLLSVITLGLALPYFAYWQFKYFASHLELAPAPAAGPVLAPAAPRPSREPAVPAAEPSVAPRQQQAAPGSAPSVPQPPTAPLNDQESEEERGPRRYQFRSPR